MKGGKLTECVSKKCNVLHCKRHARKTWTRLQLQRLQIRQHVSTSLLVMQKWFLVVMSSLKRTWSCWGRVSLLTLMRAWMKFARYQQ